MIIYWLLLGILLIYPDIYIIYKKKYLIEKQSLQIFLES